MLTTGTTHWLTRITLLLAGLAAAASTVLAQTHTATEPSLASILRPGTTVWITDAGGREEKTRVLEFLGGVLTTVRDGDTRRVRVADVARIQARHSDSVLNGALIGAGALVVWGLSVCTLVDSWRNCRDDGGPITQVATIGSVVGMAIDHVIRRRKTIYQGPPTSTRLRVAPTVDRYGTGLQMRFTF